MESRSDNSKELRTGKTVLRRTFILLVVCGIVAFVVLAARLYKLQISDHAMYEEKNRKKRKI